MVCLVQTELQIQLTRLIESALRPTTTICHPSIFEVNSLSNFRAIVGACSSNFVPLTKTIDHTSLQNLKGETWNKSGQFSMTNDGYDVSVMKILLLSRKKLWGVDI